MIRIDRIQENFKLFLPISKIEMNPLDCGCSYHTDAFTTALKNMIFGEDAKETKFLIYHQAMHHHVQHSTYNI